MMNYQLIPYDTSMKPKKLTYSLFFVFEVLAFFPTVYYLHVDLGLCVSNKVDFCGKHHNYKSGSFFHLIPDEMISYVIHVIKLSSKC